MLLLPADLQPFSNIDFSNSSCVIAAVSGGSDSLALLTLLRDALSDGAGPRLMAVTVDHGLRAGSGEEACQVGRICSDLGIEHRIMRWTASAPETGLQAKAREARYDLLARAARAVGADLVLTGHTRDDQLETVMMRETRGDGPGLAGIAPASFLWDRDGPATGVWFARPLLGQRREALRALLETRSIGWIDDPSNEDARFERVRMRRKLAAMDAAARRALEQRQAQAVITRLELDRTVALLLERSACEVAPGLLRVDAALLHAGAQDRNAAARVAGILLAFAGGQPVLPSASKLETWMARLREPGAGAVTLGRCVAKRVGDAIYVLRENRGVELNADGMVFDGRYGLCGGFDHGRLTLQAPDEDGELVIPPGVPASLVTRAARFQPVLQAGGGSRRLWRPDTDPTWYRVLNPWPRVVPSFDTGSVGALARLAGVPAIPVPPLPNAEVVDPPA